MQQEQQKEKPYIEDKRIRSQYNINEKNKRMIKHYSKKFSSYQNYQPGFIQPDEGEKTKQVSQDQIKQIVSQNTLKQQFELSLESCPYLLDYSFNSQNLLLSSKLGEISLVEWKNKNLLCTFDMNASFTDKFEVNCQSFINNNMFAIGNNFNTYIYDQQGIQIQTLQSASKYLKYLQEYMLLIQQYHNKLNFYDVTTNKYVQQLNIQNQTVAMDLDSSNGITFIADNMGKVKLFQPNMGKAVVEIFTTKNSICDISTQNNYLCVGSNDKRLKIYDIRTFKEVYSYFTYENIGSINYSQTNLLAVGQKNCIEIWKDSHLTKQNEPYMKHFTSVKYDKSKQFNSQSTNKWQINSSFQNNTIQDIKFVPYHDYLGYTCFGYFEQIIVPGSGFAQYDTFVNNIYKNKKQKKESNVRQNLEKLDWRNISINQNKINQVNVQSEQVRMVQIKERKNKTRGRNKTNKINKLKLNQQDQIRREKLRKVYSDQQLERKINSTKLNNQEQILKNI